MAKYRIKKQKEETNVAGIIVTILFLLLLAGGIYYLVNLFKAVEINEINIAGDWKLAGSPTWYLSINSDGTASSYEQFTAGDVRNQVNYSYTLYENDNGVMIIALKDLKTKEVEEIKITKVSHAEIAIIRNGSHFLNLTRVNIF